MIAQEASPEASLRLGSPMNSLDRRLASTPLWAPLASLLLALAWLIPNTSQPWVAFQKEFWAAITFALVGLVLALRWWRARRAFEADPLACVLALLAVYALLQWTMGIQYFFGHAAVGATYFLGAACAVVVGRAWEREQPGIVARWLFPALLVASIGTVGLILKQWLGVDGLEVWTYPMPDNQRPFGNMLQPNNAGTLLVLGIVSAFWLHARGQVGAPVLLLAAGAFLFAIVVTQSRTTYLNFVLLSAAGAWFAPRLFPRGARWIFFALVAWFLAAHVLVAQTNPEANLAVLLAERTGGGRWEAWKAFTVAALAHPLTGLGFQAGVVTQMTAFQAGHAVDGYFAWGHNALLDIAAWFGVPAALAVALAGAQLVRRVALAPFSPVLAFYAAAAFAPLLHGMVELPLAYAFFLLPVALLLGALSAHLAIPAVRLDARVVFALVVALTASSLVIATDYLRVERSVYAVRFKAANVGRTHVLDLPETLLLAHQRAYIIGVRLPIEVLDPQQVRDFEQAVALEPSPSAMHRLVTRLVADGELERARYWIAVARQTTPPEQRKLLAQSWRQLVARDGKYGQVQWPE
jgi:hypothetical protein